MTFDTLPLATEAAAALDGWTVGKSHGDTWLHHPDGGIVKIGQGKGRPVRVEVTGILPAGSSQHMPAITVAAARGGTALADEIRRRLLPAYGEALDLAQAERAAAKRLADQYEQLLRQLRAPLPTATPDRWDPTKAFRWRAGPRDFGRRPSAPDWHTAAEVSITGSQFEVDIRLRWLPAEVAAQILQLLGTAAAARWAPAASNSSGSRPRRNQQRRLSRRDRRLHRREQRRRHPAPNAGSAPLD
ncbi:hypothetical protein [Kitasatospora purpeofusca]|uniref:hypothetical protein n=1 Tax=Kitasatospora purpeofusca TaxID=67352 RepID=UPI0036C64BB9